MSELEEARELQAAAGGTCPNCGTARPDLSTPCPECGDPPLGPAAVAPEGGARRTGVEALMQVRNSDVEPYTGLRYLSKLFRMIAIILVLLLIAEVVTGLSRQGSEAIPTLLAEASRLIVLSALLWGIGDLALLLVDMGHDVRATRILIGRQTAHLIMADHQSPTPASGTPTVRATPPAAAPPVEPGSGGATSAADRRR